MNKIYIALLLLLPLLLLSGCGRHRRTQSRRKTRFATIKVGTKKQDIIAAFGKPARQFTQKNKSENTEVLEFERRKASGGAIAAASVLTIATCGLYAVTRYPVFFLKDVDTYRFEFVDDQLVQKSTRRRVERTI